MRRFRDLQVGNYLTNSSITRKEIAGYGNMICRIAFHGQVC